MRIRRIFLLAAVVLFVIFQRHFVTVNIGSAVKG